MTMQRVIDILRTERECVERAGTATPNKACDRACADCDLVLDDKEILEAYTLAIGCIEGLMPDVPDKYKAESEELK